MQATDSPWRPGLGFGRTALSVDHTVISTDIGKNLVYSGSGAHTVTLTAAATLGVGFCVMVSNAGGSVSSVTIAPNGAELIRDTNGGFPPTLKLGSGQTVAIMCTGTGWESITACGPMIGQSQKLVTGATALTFNDYGRTVLCSATPYTVTLPAGTSGSVTWSGVVFNTGTGALTLAPVSAFGTIKQGLKNQATMVLLPGQGAWLITSNADFVYYALLTSGPTCDPVVTLTDAATIATDASLGSIFEVTLTASRTLGAPTNPTSGQKAIWRIKQDGTGGWTLAYNAVFRFSTSIPSPTLSTAINTMDMIGAVYNATDVKWDVCAVSLGYA